MKVTVFGTSKWQFVDEKTGEMRRGITAHCTSEVSNSNWKGLEYSKYPISIDSPLYANVDNLALPATLKLEFNRFGKVCDFEVLDNV